MPYVSGRSAAARTFLCILVDFGRSLQAEAAGLHTNPLQWRWVNELGVHNAVDARELVDALLSGRMTPHVWVWRTGWKAWLRASQVPDLASAIPKGARLPPASIEIDPMAVEPPPIPHYSFHESRYVRHASTPVPPAAHQRPLVRRPLAPTLVDSENVASQTLRPPGAVPPPPRRYSDTFALDVQRALDLATFASDDPNVAVPEHHASSTVSQRPSIAPRLVPAPAPDFVIQSVLGEATPQSSSRGASPAVSRTSGMAHPSTRIRRRPLAIGLSLVALASAGIVWLRTRAVERDRVAVVAAERSAKPRVPAFCRMVGSAARIAPSVVFNVPPFLETNTDGRSLAVGFADSPNSAAGIIVDPESLAVKYVFRKPSAGRVASVVPRVSDGQLSFMVNLDKDALKDARPLAGPNPFTFAHTLEGFVRQPLEAEPETIWATDIDAAITGTRLVTVAPVGHAVTYRQGGLTGRVWFGWLLPDGRSLVPPFALPTGAKFVGQPSVAASGSTALVSFAGRASDKDPWRVHLSKLHGASREALERIFPPPPGGPGGDSIAPSAVGLGEGRFLLQWSEGSSGHWQVRVQTLNQTLEPLGPPIDASPADANAGQGTLWVQGSRSVSLFIVNIGHSAELWAASLDCPR